MEMTMKPRAKWLNDLLLTKRCVRHATTKRPSRQKQKQQFRRDFNALG